MKLLYTADLHGHRWKYESCLKQAIAVGADVIINGGDMLPKQGNFFTQDQFIYDFLDDYFSQLTEASIPYLCCLGSDDLRIWDVPFDQMCQKHDGIYNLAQQQVTLAETTFMGMNWIADTPFGLKDRCRLDTLDGPYLEQFGPSVLSAPDGWQEIPDWHAYIRQQPTLTDELAALPTVPANHRSVYVIPMPPHRLELDACADGNRVGSKAVYDFLAHTQPHLALHGLIHKSPAVTNLWQANLKSTLCIQPGQMEDFTSVLIDLETLDTARHTLKQPDNIKR
ncbi:phosphoesterase [Planctomycetota bacterium]